MATIETKRDNNASCGPKTIVAGIFAHVDAGKTTLSEALLYRSGEIRKLGRVDHRDAFLDTHPMERERGITIFSKQARLTHEDMELVLVDTPGHVDFSTEAERTMQVLDCAILVVSASAGVQAHTETLWRLLSHYGVPTFVFVNKCDLAGASYAETLSQLEARFGSGFVDCNELARQGSASDEFYDSLAMLSESAMEQYLENGTVGIDEIRAMVFRRELFCCIGGSALKLEGVDEMLDAMDRFATQANWNDEFGAQVYKISHDDKGERLTWMKVTGGSLRVKESICGGHVHAQDETSVRKAGVQPADAVNGWHPGPRSYLESSFGSTRIGNDVLDDRPWTQKVNQIRLYSGSRFRTVDSVEAGQICAVTGLTQTSCGQSLGAQAQSVEPKLMPALSYRANLPKGCDVVKAMQALRMLEDEDPMLGVTFNERLQEIRIQLMGEIQLETIRQQLSDRFGLDISFDSGSVMYRETILAPTTGCGHFEPLRHYAETRLLIEPLPIGSGILVGSSCSEDVLDLNWQRLIVTHALEKEHLGTLTGAPVTDIRITLIAGRAHAKHTEGGDFRQATYRAIRQGLMRSRERGECQLLEPWYSFTLEVPQDQVGRAISDIERMSGTFDAPVSNGEFATIKGRAPVSEMQGYSLEVRAYSHGLGRLSCIMSGYAPCHDQQRIVDELGYDPKADLENTPDSVFCSHGAGYPVDWFDVEDHMHT